MYPTHLRGTGESFALNIGGRLLGASAALVTTQLANVMPGDGTAARLAYSAGTVAVLAYSMSLIGSFWLSSPYTLNCLSRISAGNGAVRLDRRL